MTAWKKEICASRPADLQVIGHSVYAERRDIREVEHPASEEAEAYTDYECEMREISFSEYESLKAYEAIKTEEAIDSFVMQLIEEGIL